MSSRFDSQNFFEDMQAKIQIHNQLYKDAIIKFGKSNNYVLLVDGVFIDTHPDRQFLYDKIPPNAKFFSLIQMNTDYISA